MTDRERESDQRRSSRRPAGLFSILMVLAAGALIWLLSRGSGDEDVPVRIVLVPTPPPPVTTVDSLGRGQILGDILGAHGFSPQEVLDFVEAMSPYESPRRLRPGMPIQLVGQPAATPDRVSLLLDPDRTLHMFPGDSPGWIARLDSVPVVTDTIVLAGLIKTNVVEAELSGEIENVSPVARQAILFQVSQIFQWQIDFRRDVQPNDAYRALIAREVRPDGSMRSARVLAAEFLNAGTLLTSVRFQPSEDVPVEFFEENGEALRSQFLFAPVDLARVTSGFSYRRFHPILRRSRPHLGIDYGAPRGTPVRATGDGVVARAGRWGSFGLIVEIRHANNIRTRYAHLSSITSGVQSGVRLAQGQLIGRVGRTGLATANHLHYEFLRNGQQVNPARLNLPRAEPVSEEMRPLFEAQRDFVMDRLRQLPLPGPVAANVDRAGGAGPRTED